MRQLLYKLFGVHYAFITNESGYTIISKVKYPQSRPMSKESYFDKMKRDIFLLSDGTTNTSGRWQMLYPDNYVHPLVKNDNILAQHNLEKKKGNTYVSVQKPS